MRKFDENTTRFISDLKRKCKDYAINLYFGKGNKVNCDGDFVAGYFDPVDKKLAVSNDHDFLLTLIHESCHLDQYIENCKIWKQYDKLNFEYDDINDVLNNKTTIDPVKFCKTVAKLEWDCEKRSVEKIKEYNLNIDIKEYSKQANAYIYFWLHLPEIKCWYKKGRKGPHRQKRLLDVCPTKIDIEFKSEIPNKVLNKLHLIYKK